MWTREHLRIAIELATAIAGLYLMLADFHRGATADSSHLLAWLSLIGGPIALRADWLRRHPDRGDG